MSENLNYAPLRKSVLDGKIKTVRNILRRHETSFWKEFSEGPELICKALSNDDPNTAELLLTHGFKINRNEGEIGTTPLHIAIKKGYVDIVAYLLEKGASITALDNENNTPFHTAVEKGCYFVVELIFNQAVSIGMELSSYLNLPNKAGNTVLHLAVTELSYEITELLLKNNANIDRQDSQGMTPLAIACKQGNCAFCEFLLKFGPDVNIANYAGISPLHYAIKSNNYEIAELLMLNHADVNKKTSDDVTPIFQAAEYEDPKLCALLLRFGAEVNVSNQIGESPLHISVIHGCYEVAEFLLNNKADVNKKTNANISSIYLAAAGGFESLFRLLLKFEAEIDLDMKAENNNMIHHAVRYKKNFMITKIFEKCNVDRSKYLDLFKTASETVTNYGILKRQFDSTLHLSGEVNDVKFLTSIVQGGYLGIFQRVLELGIDVNIGIDEHDYCNCTLLHTAIKFKRIDIAEQLINHGAEINITNCDGDSPLSIAVSGANTHLPTNYKRGDDPLCFAKKSFDLELVELLLKWGGKVDCFDSRGWTPLFEAAFIGKLPLVQLLLRYGASPNEGNRSKQTALHSACLTPKKEILKILLKSGADICLEDKSGQTAIDCISNDISNHQECRSILQAHIVKLKVLNVRLSSRIFDEPTEFIPSDFQENCAVELEEMKKEDINVSDEFFISFSDLLYITSEELVDLMKENDFGPVIESLFWRKKFPIYQDILHFKLVAAYRNLKLANDLTERFRSLWPSLPDLCLRKLAGYFNQQESMKLIETFNLR